MTDAARRLVEVALPVPLFRTFVYSLEGEYDYEARVGSRVLVPFRKRHEIGVVVATDAAEPARGIVKPVASVPDAEPALDDALLALARWISEYYVVPLGIVVRSVLPALLSGASQLTPAVKTRRVVSIRDDIPTLLQREKAFARAPQQRALFELLESLGGTSSVEHLLEQLQFSPSVLSSLEKRALVTIEREQVQRDPFAGRTPRKEERHVPTAEQLAVIQRLRDGKPGDVFLLHGVTGSGKTLVYIELLKDIVMRQGRTAIVLVPEIALTPQTVDRFRAVFGDDVAVLHSALSDGERYDAWSALRRGDKRIAVGARSAIFAPLANLGAIIVDEEHESSYKQGETPRYHARETAIVRATAEGAVVVLGSATPSLESWTNAAAGKFQLLELPDRVGGATLPVVQVVDLRKSVAESVAKGGEEDYQRVITSPLDAAIRTRLDRGEQSILLLNRRGYSAFVQCDSCGNVATCPNCSITLTYHRSPERLVCHYCMHQEEPQRVCKRCGGVTLRRRGLGTQQVEKLVCERFPSARVARMDVDTTSAKWAHAEILDRVGAGEVDILLGTQMIAKGLDFPNVTFVGVIDADVGINLPDFRASERCFQLLSQVAGRSGRAMKGGEVLIQTRVPTHHAVTCAVTHDYRAFVTEELAGRVNPPYPPNNRLANIVFSGTVESSVADLAIAGTAWLRRLARARESQGITIVGPAPSAVERIKTRWRWHVLLKSEHPHELTRVARYFLERFAVPARDGLRVTLDRDPVSLL
ncbi:MAG: primosomal protein N' [Gemmatimonadota bacterium]|nr:primosomal protein N' [Gemmatimonadota bacterium]